MNTIKEIQTALDALVAWMVEKGVVRPEAQVQVKSDGRFAFHAGCAYETKPFDGDNYFVFHADTLPDLFWQAQQYIATLPNPEDRTTHEYMRKVADAIDFGAKHSIDDKYVTPLRGVTKAMTDNLLTKVSAE